MIGNEIGVRSGEELVRLVRALGQHRYVASRLHLVHAFALESIGDEWAASVIAETSIDLASKDERLFRRASDAELVAVLAALWGKDDSPRERLATRLRQIDVDPSLGRPFDETHEGDLFPIFVDAGWELIPLTQLDPERHQGATNAFGDELAWQIAKFEEENRSVPEATLHELPLLGAAELLRPEDGTFVLWAQGNETYLDYVLRGVMKVAKL